MNLNDAYELVGRYGNCSSAADLRYWTTSVPPTPAQLRAAFVEVRLTVDLAEHILAGELFPREDTDE